MSLNKHVGTSPLLSAHDVGSAPSSTDIDVSHDHELVLETGQDRVAARRQLNIEPRRAERDFLDVAAVVGADQHKCGRRQDARTALENKLEIVVPGRSLDDALLVEIDAAVQVGISGGRPAAN